MPTILELFHSSGLKKSVKADTETLVEQETSGIRVKTAVELNNPLIYGNEAARIVTRSTPVLEDMKKGTGGPGADGGLIGKGIGKLTKGKLNSIADVRDEVNSKLGIPSNQIPSRIIEQIEGQTSDVPVTLGENGNEFGKFLKSTGGGNPKTILKQGVGKGIGFAKDKLRGVLFGEPAAIGENKIDNPIEPRVNITNNEVPYTLYKNSPEGGDKYSENPDLTKSKLQIPTVPSTSDLIDKSKTILKSGIGKSKGKASLSNTEVSETEAAVSDTEPRVMEFSSEVPYTLYKNSPEGGNIYSEDSKISLEGTKLDLSKVSPIYGITRKDGVFGKLPEENNGYSYAFKTKDGNNPILYNQDNPYTGVNGSPNSLNKISLENLAGVDKIDEINRLSPSDNYTINDDGTISIDGRESDIKDLIPLHIGKLGAKQVVFRSTVTGISETVSPSWSGNKFVGNPYQYYTYTGVERSITFSLNIYCMSPLELISNWEKITALTKMAYPTISSGRQINPPIIQFRLGDLYVNKIGFIESLTHTIPDKSNWETDGELGYLPKLIDCSIGIKFIEDERSVSSIYGYKKSKAAIEKINEERELNSIDLDSRTDQNGTPNENSKGKKVDERGNTKENIVTYKDDSKKKIRDIKTGIKQETPEDKSLGIEGDNVNQSASADKLNGKTPTQASKEQEIQGLTRVQSRNLTSFLSKGYKQISKNEVLSDSNNKKWIKDDTGNSIFVKRTRYGKSLIYQLSSTYSIPYYIGGGPD